MSRGKVPRRLISSLKKDVRKALEAWYFGFNGSEAFWSLVEHYIEATLPFIRGYVPTVDLLLTSFDEDGVRKHYVELHVRYGRKVYVVLYSIEKNKLVLDRVETIEEFYSK